MSRKIKRLKTIKQKFVEKKENTKISTKLSIHGVGYNENFSVAKNIVYVLTTKYIPRQTEAIIVVSLL